MSAQHKEGRKEKRRRDDAAEEEGARLPDVHINDSGGEVSMSVEATNKMRIALGLKPLKLDSELPKKEARKAETSKDAKPSKASADELREKIKHVQDKRRAEQLLSAKPLGAKDDEEDDDVYAWVQKVRKTEEALQEPGDRPTSKPTRRGGRHKERSRRQEEEEDEDEDEEGSLKYSVEQLAGMKVRHDYKELDDGEMLVLTLADKGILDDMGDLVEDGDDELENVLKAEDKKRKKAREAAQKKAKPLFEEDGKRRSLLDKYDEEEEEMIRLGDDAAIEARRQQVKEEVRKKLAQSVEQLEAANKGASDYYTHEEASTMFKKKKRKKGSKQLRQKQQGEDEEAGDTAALIEALEAEAELNKDGKQPDLGKRGERMTARDKAAAQEAARVQESRERFDKALEKANWAALALKNYQGAGNGDGKDVEDDADRELYESLARARRAAAKEAAAGTSKLEEVAEMVARKGEEDESKVLQQLDSQAGGIEFTETREFVHSIQPAADEPIPRISGLTTAIKAPLPGLQSVKMDVDDHSEAGVKTEEGPEAVPTRGPKYGKWVTAEKTERREEHEDDDMMDVSDEEDTKKPLEMQEAGLTREKIVGRGLAACLGLLKEKGELKQKLEWAGRTNDKKKTQIMGLEDVYTGGTAEDRLALGIEVALTQRDEYGRILTPKERFRELSYRFHGKAPSKNKQEKRQKQAQVEIARRRAATSENPNDEVEQMKQMQAKSGNPFVVLQGKDSKNLATSSKPSKQAPVSNRSTMKTPMLGGGYTPLTDPQKKVQAMYGIKKSGSSSSMLPPPPRRPPAAL